jgi:hypothetical protein
MRTGIYLLCITLFLFSCAKEKESSTFSYDFEDQFAFPATSTVNIAINRYSGNQSTDSENKFEDNDTKAELVQYINVDGISLGLLSPSTESFDFAKSIKIYIDAAGVDETLIASFTDIPEESSRALDLNVVDSDFQEFLKQDQIVFRINIENRRTVPQDITLKLDASFDARADVYRED